MSQAMFDKGLKVRKEVLGAEYVDAAIKNADDFTRPFQELVTEYAWGAVWGREGLSRAAKDCPGKPAACSISRCSLR